MKGETELNKINNIFEFGSEINIKRKKIDAISEGYYFYVFRSY